jgi:transcriptional regulator GlxA family with amidase domain
LRDRYAITNDRVLKVLAHMEAAVEEPAPRTDLARIAGVSVRQLERLFLAQLGETVNRAYLRIRLAQAEDLVRKTGLSATAIALACGFRNSSHFSRVFKSRFGHPPSRHERG